MVSHDGLMINEIKVNQMKSSQSNERKTFCDVTLMGQFNYISKNISSWSNNWSNHIKDIVVATPEGTPIEEDTFGSIMFYQQDSGITSPYSNILRVLKERNNINCLLYVHDDLLITGSTLCKIGRQGWISTVYIESSQLESDNIITLYRNGTSFAHGNWNLDHWGHWSACRNTFLAMFNDTVVEHYVEKSNTDEEFINVRIGPSDMLYLSLWTTEQRLWLLNIFELFTKHSLHLECAVPTAVFWMKRRFKIKVHNANLCTDWGGLRSNPGQLIENCNNECSYDVFHPIKIGVVGNWTEYFNYLINRY